MNWPSARSRRASAPRRTTKRAPAILAAVAKSIMPSASPSSKCCFGWNPRSRGSPCWLSTTLAVSSGPSGTSGSSTLGSDSRMRLIASSLAAACFSSPSISLRNAVASASRAEVSAPVRLPCPISRASALRRACFSCSDVSSARRWASCARSSDDTGASPRRASAASKPAGSERTARMSCIGSHLDWFWFNYGSGKYGYLVKCDQRQRETGLRDDIRRCQDRGYDKHADIGVAAEALQSLRRNDPYLCQQGQQHRQLERQAECEDQLHHEVEVFAYSRQ